MLEFGTMRRQSNTPRFLRVRDEIIPGSISRLQCSGITQHPQSEACTRDSNIQAPLVRQEADRTSLIGSNGTEDNDVHLLTLSCKPRSKHASDVES